jgi:hypothetical protein
MSTVSRAAGAEDQDRPWRRVPCGGGWYWTQDPSARWRLVVHQTLYLLIALWPITLMLLAVIVLGLLSLNLPEA